MDDQLTGFDDAARLRALGKVMLNLLQDLRCLDAEYAEVQRDNGTRDDARGFVMVSLDRLQRALLEGATIALEGDIVRDPFAIMGSTATQLLFDVVAAAALDPEKQQAERRHWLTSIPQDEFGRDDNGKPRQRLAIWRDAPSRISVMTLAAAILKVFSHEAKEASEHVIAQEIGQSLFRGGFDNERRDYAGSPKLVGPSTIKAWVETYSGGTTAEGRKVTGVQMTAFKHRVEWLRHQRDHGRTREQMLALLEDHCRRVSPPST
jgi:hypothetical protein